MRSSVQPSIATLSMPDYPEMKCIHELFEAQVARNPHAVAVVLKDEKLTYGDLNAKANQVAHYLVERGVKPDALVGLCVERSLEIVIGLLGILKAGGAYVPIDPSHPQSRIDYVLRDSVVEIVLTESNLLSVLPLDKQQILLLDSDRREIQLAGYSTENINKQDINLCSTHLAYVIYTSGSTGQPKGVMLEHHGVCNLVQWQARYFAVANNSRIAQFASYTFDGSVGETFMALLNGATLVMLERHQSPMNLMKNLNDYAINVVVLVPSLLKELDPSLISNPEQLTVVAVGETCPVELAQKWSSHCNFHNGYGPTECTVYSHIWKMPRSPSTQLQLRVPIGKPVDHITSYILDEHLNPVSAGEIGEIFLSGPGLARGYLNRPDLTAEKFIPNPFFENSLYFDGGEIKEASPAELLSDLNAKIASISCSHKTLAISEALPVTDLMDIVKNELDADLLDKTKRFVAKYSNKQASYECFQRYVLEGINNNYASCGIGVKVLSTLLPFDDYSKIKGVDFGFGNAEVLNVLKQMGTSVIGLDVNPIFVDKARNIGLDARMVKIDVDPDVFENESGILKQTQDFAISTLTLDRVEKPINLLLNILAVLKTGGRFAIQTLLPVVGIEDGEIEDPVIYTPAENRITPGENPEEDKINLVNILSRLGASNIYVYHMPYIVKSRDGVQEYKLWSICGKKQSHDAYISQNHRLYRTGDLGLYGADGNAEFIGRIDDQVKLRGFRIELGEISARLAEHPAVKDAVVSVWEPQPDDKRLVAHVVADNNYALPDTESTTLIHDIVAQQQQVFDINYASSDANPLADFTGWNSSYDGTPILEDDMAGWRSATVQRIVDLKPANILEIGFGTGLMLYGIVPHCQRYVGTDLSPTVYHNTLKNLPLLGADAAKVTLLNRPAHDLSALAGQAFDTIVMNSVVQYFPDVDYFLSVIAQSKQQLTQDGKIFVGDVRCHGQLLDMLHASIELFTSNDDTQSINEFRQAAKYKADNDSELVIARELFLALKAQSGAIKHVQIIPNLDGSELKYRYSAILYFGEVALVDNITFIPWQAAQHSLEQIKAHLSDAQPAVFALSGIAHKGLYRDLQALTANSADMQTVGDLKKYIAQLAAPGLHPRQLTELANGLDYYCELSWINSDETGAFDAVLTQKNDKTTTPPINVFAGTNKALADMALRTYANNPRLRDMRRALTPVLRNHLSALLPSYMLPSYFMFYNALPLTSVGKINHKALLVPDVLALQVEGYVAPETDAERQLAKVWADVLGFEVDQLGTHSNFFSLGGDSISSLQVIARARKLGLHFTPKQLFEHKTIAKLAAVVERISGSKAEQGQVSGKLPFTPIQHWFFNLKLVDSHHYNQAVLLEVPHALRAEALSGAFKAVIKHHDALRLRLEKNGADWVQNIAEWNDNDEALIMHSDLSSLPPEAQCKALGEEAAGIQARLNMGQGPILRVVRFHLGAGAADRLIIAIHHLAVDEVSWRILLEDLATAYSQLEAGEPARLPLKTTSYKAWSEYLQDYAQSETLLAELGYWQGSGQGSGQRPFVPLPQDKQCPADENILATTAVCTVNLDEDTTRDLLHKVPGAYHTELNDILLTAVTLAFHQWTGENTLLLNISGHGREQLSDEVDLTRTVGWFSTIFPVGLTLESDTDLGAALKSIKEQLRQIPNKGLGYGVLRYCNRNPAVTQSLEKLPAPQVSFNCLDELDQTTPKGNLFQLAKESAGSPRSPKQTRAHVIDLCSVVKNGCLVIAINYSTALHEEQTISRLGGYLSKNLQALIEHCLSPGAGGYTPSDFPEAGLSQESLEALFAELGKKK